MTERRNIMNTIENETTETTTAETTAETTLEEVVPTNSNLLALFVMAKALETEASGLNADYSRYQRNSIEFIRTAINTYVTLTKAQDYAELNQSFLVITTVKGSVCESNAKMIRTIGSILNLSDIDRKNALVKKLVTIVNNESIAIGSLNNFANSFNAIETGKKLVHVDYSYIATDDNIVTEKVAKKESLLLPEVGIGGLYFTDEQLAEVEIDAKSKITYGRELKKLSAIMVGVMKTFEGKEINADSFKEFLTEHVDIIVDTYIEKSTEVKALTKSELEIRVKELEAELAKKREENQEETATPKKRANG